MTRTNTEYIVQDRESRLEKYLQETDVQRLFMSRLSQSLAKMTVRPSTKWALTKRGSKQWLQWSASSLRFNCIIDPRWLNASLVLGNTVISLRRRSQVIIMWWPCLQVASPRAESYPLMIVKQQGQASNLASAPRIGHQSLLWIKPCLDSIAKIIQD